MAKNNGECNDLSGEDRQRAVQRLRQLLPVKFLRDYLGSEVERLVAACEQGGTGRRSKVDDDDLAELLLDLHGAEILRHRTVREQIVRAVPRETLEQLVSLAELPPPRGVQAAIEQVAGRKWTPGKLWASRFCSCIDLPMSLAGQPDGGSGPAVEELIPFVPLPSLHDYQEDLRDRLIDVIQHSDAGKRGLLSLPTGAGKTRTAVEALVQCVRDRTVVDGHVLWIAQSEELCEQAVQAFREVWNHQTVMAAGNNRPDSPEIALQIFRLWGTRPLPAETDRGIFVASIQKLESLRKSNSDLYQTYLDRVRIVIVDEAHHAIARSYNDLFKGLGFGQQKGHRALIGLTATPYRGSEEDTQRLIKRFGANLVAPPWENAVKVLRERSILAKTEIKRVETLCKYRLTANEMAQYRIFAEIPDAALQRIGRDNERNRKILQQLTKVEIGRPVLFFACSVVHARAIALLLRRQGRTAAAVTGETPRALRRHWIDEFKRGSIQFLCNYGILTTGFDAPKVEVVVLGRPTTSVLLYEQMVGRGMRGPGNGGTEACTVIDLVDSFDDFGEPMSYERYRKLWQEFASKRFV